MKLKNNDTAFNVLERAIHCFIIDARASSPHSNNESHLPPVIATFKNMYLNHRIWRVDRRLELVHKFVKRELISTEFIPYCLQFNTLRARTFLMRYGELEESEVEEYVVKPGKLAELLKKRISDRQIRILEQFIAIHSTLESQLLAEQDKTREESAISLEPVVSSYKREENRQPAVNADEGTQHKEEANANLLSSVQLSPDDSPPKKKKAYFTLPMRLTLLSGSSMAIFLIIFFAWRPDIDGSTAVQNGFPKLSRINYQKPAIAAKSLTNTEQQVSITQREETENGTINYRQKRSAPDSVEKKLTSEEQERNVDETRAKREHAKRGNYEAVHRSPHSGNRDKYEKPAHYLETRYLAYQLPPAALHLNYIRGDQHQKKISLTFDGGSKAQDIEEILNTLDKFGLKVTFFLTGEFIKSYPKETRMIVARGHEVGNHTYSHPHMKTLSDDEFKLQLLKNETLFHQVTGKKFVPFWRAPYGEFIPHQSEIARSLGYTHIHWTHWRTRSESLDTIDWVEDPSSALFHSSYEIVSHILNSNYKKGGIVLMHVGAREIDPLIPRYPELIKGLKSRGYQIVSISELLFNRR